MLINCMQLSPEAFAIPAEIRNCFWTIMVAVLLLKSHWHLPALMEIPGFGVLVCGTV